MKIDRVKAAIIAQETLAIVRKGSYYDTYGESHNIRDDVQKSRHHTKEYAPEWKAKPMEVPRYTTTITVENAPTLQVAKNLWEEGHDVIALNFASARNPGGGFLTGARAQEEYLCRNSTLYACLENQPFYEFHKKQKGSFYSSATLYSPAVPVIRDEFNFLMPPWKMNFLTAAAPNITREVVPLPKLRAAFEERTRKILAIAEEHGHDALVLGAWGCGAFGNDPQLVAQIWKEQLEGDFKNHFARVSFAVLDHAPNIPNFRAFQKEFEP
jgi:uncharacterized protein (TIGR02452 family)